METKARSGGRVLSLPRPLVGLSGRASNYVSRRRYRLPLGYSLPPNFIHLHMTWKCNLRCGMCPYWGDIGARKEMPVEQVRRDFTREELLHIVEDLATFKPTVCLIGGEPLLHESVPDVLAALGERGVPTQVMTNGVLLEKYAEDIVTNGVEQVGISIDGPAEVHDEIRGISGTFKRLQAGVRLVQDLKRECGSSVPRLVVNLTLNTLNVERLAEMAEVAASLRPTKLRINHQWFTTSEDFQSYVELSQRLLGVECKTWGSYVRQLPVVNLKGFQETMSELRREIEEMGIELVEFPRFDSEELADYYSRPDFRPRSYPTRCADPWYTAYIMPDGSLWMCAETDYSVGNVLDSSLLKLWNNERARHYRQQLRRLGAFPVCWRCCGLYKPHPK